MAAKSSESGYQPPLGFANPHVQTVWARTLRRVPRLPYRRERFETEDGDFIDLDFVVQAKRRIAVICHGLESSANAPYVRAMALTMMNREWDVVAMNFRSCSGEPNRMLRSYHSGETEDLHRVVNHLSESLGYETLVLIGFSLGGNVVLKYAGERGRSLPMNVRAVAAISAPCDLASCAQQLAMPSNRFYMRRFLRLLQEKMETREQLFPGAVDYEALRLARDFGDFDRLYTARVHGFSSAEDYWEKSSARNYVGGLQIPALLLNAEDDPFLTTACHLKDEVVKQPLLTVEVSQHGGHVGFVQFGRDGRYYPEERIPNWIAEKGF